MPRISYSVTSKNRIDSFNKTIEVDSDKSISIRAFLISSISQGISRIKNVLESEDVFSTIDCLKKLGIRKKKIGKKNYIIYGKGLGSLAAKKNITLNCGNSGTLARLLVGILSTTPNINLKISGDKSLRKRKMTKLINIMNRFGASFQRNKSYFPINMISSSMPLGINYVSGISAEAELPNLLPESYKTDIALFFDTANVWGVDYSSSIDDSNTIRSSIGIASNVFTPVGPLSWTLAQPLSKASTDRTQTFNFNIGTSF